MHEDGVLQAGWLPLCAFTYIILCLFDFVIMPISVEVHNSEVIALIVEKATDAYKESHDVVPYLETIKNAKIFDEPWKPLTLEGAGLVHLAFGALLAGGSVTRGFVKKAKVEGEYKVAMSNGNNGANGTTHKTE